VKNFIIAAIIMSAPSMSAFAQSTTTGAPLVRRARRSCNLPNNWTISDILFRFWPTKFRAMYVNGGWSFQAALLTRTLILGVAV
jgi:hypothetical protein